MRIYTMLLLLLLVSNHIFSQGRISGRLTDSETQEPLIIANVFLQGTIKGTTSDFDGNFVLSGVSEGEQTLIISFLGYEQVQKVITVKDCINGH